MPSAMPDLPALLAKIALGDRAAFRALYDATQRNLFPVARRICRNDSWADEVLQESYMTVWHRAATFDASKASPMTWMTTIVRNRALDRLSLASVRHEAAVDAADLDALPADAARRRAWADDAELCRRLHHCVSHLEARQRQSVALAYLNGLSAQRSGRAPEAAARVGEGLDPARDGAP